MGGMLFVVLSSQHAPTWLALTHADHSTHAHAANVHTSAFARVCVCVYVCTPVCCCHTPSIQTQHRRIVQLEAEVEALRVDAGRQQEAFMKQRAQTRAAEAQIQELQQELENNAGVYVRAYV